MSRRRSFDAHRLGNSISGRMFPYLASFSSFDRLGNYHCHRGLPQIQAAANCTRRAQCAFRYDCDAPPASVFNHSSGFARRDNR